MLTIASMSVFRAAVTPEVETDMVVSSLRNSWLHGAGSDARFCVASGMSSSSDASLHWLHRLNRSDTVANGRADLNLRLHSQSSSGSADAMLPSTSPRRNRSAAAQAASAAAGQLQQDAARARELTRVYNNFLRHKVFQIMRDMCRSVTDPAARPFSYAFMMDADTAVNRTNLENFVAGLDPTAAVYTGLCKRRNTWNHQQQRGVGGGPGILMSRPLLESVCPNLEQCAPLRTLMDRLQFAGGDLMLAKCMEFLGHRCNLEKELPWSQQQQRRVRLDEAFRRGPPWVYPPLAGGTILVATRRSAGARALEMYERLTTRGIPLQSVISFHRVRPSTRANGMGKDPRCRVFAEYRRLESGPAHWSSRCLPSFVLLGTPKSGTTSLFNWLLQHSDVRAPVRKELHFWAPVLTPEKNCADRSACGIYQAAAAAAAAAKEAGQSSNGGGGSAATFSKLNAGRMLALYLDLFPRVDPREFVLTGEASPAYMYSPSAAMFFESNFASQIKLLLLLRDPADRAFSEFKNKRDLMLKGAPKATVWVHGHARFRDLVSELRRVTEGCAPEQLYAACAPCARFKEAPSPRDKRSAQGPARALPASRGGTENATGGLQHGRCVVPPVIWQSWYHLFVPRYLHQGPNLLLEFSDDMFSDADAMMSRVGSFLGLPAHKYQTSVAYNTEKRRGAYISQVGQTKRGGDEEHALTNQADAKEAAASRSKASKAHLSVVEALMRHSVAQLQSVLERTTWDAPPTQFRRALPPRWVARYGLARDGTPHVDPHA